MSASIASIRPRRSVLYMPGANERALEKAKTLPADSLILDLEDAVAPEAKVEARDRVCGVVKAGGYGPRELIIRVNGQDTEWGKADLKAAAHANPDAILAPKVTCGDDIRWLDETISEAGAPRSLQLWVMIETPLSILNIKEIGATAKTTRLAGFVMGSNDLIKDFRAEPMSGRENLAACYTLAIAAARAYDILVFDGVYNDIANAEGFAAEARQAKAFGFDGKTLIHPTQVEPCNTIFAPPADAVAQARDVITAFADPANASKGVLKVNGKMTELLHLAQAKRLVAVAEAIAAREAIG
ncbi:MAG TPA: CoA ester lyase [Hyphomonadaceae bacterium]|jgi:citrate lyase subunit beta/citryl-CoA lyase|nr:CoA ester lyase [Hyphomonadaceae bacterium]